MYIYIYIYIYIHATTTHIHTHTQTHTHTHTHAQTHAHTHKQPSPFPHTHTHSLSLPSFSSLPHVSDNYDEDGGDIGNLPPFREGETYALTDESVPLIDRMTSPPGLFMCKLVSFRIDWSLFT